MDFAKVAGRGCGLMWEVKGGRGFGQMRDRTGRGCDMMRMGRREGVV